jgi:hypothetical protein
VSDKQTVGRFADNAERILEVAESIHAASHAVSDWTILIGPLGGIQMLAGNDWSLESLQADRGARMVYRVSRQRGSVRVQGRAGPRTCLFEAGKPNGVARLLPAEVAAYPIVAPTKALPPAGT